MKNARQAVFSKVLLLLVCAFSVGSCSDTRPKILGSKTLQFSGNDTNTPSSFAFNFALQDEGNDNLFYLQGAANSKTSVVTTCNSAGSNCVCVFLDSNEEEIDHTTSAQIRYDTTGNYFRCTLGSSFSGDNVRYVKLRNQNSTITSTNYAVDTKTTMTLPKLIGSELEATKVRSIYRYECEHTYLQKRGTTEENFDCTDQGAANFCSQGGGSGDFCLLKSNFPYYLWADRKSVV